MKIPDGYIEITGRERVYRSDLVWNPVYQKWEHPKASPYRPFADSSGYYCVIRRTGQENGQGDTK